MLLLKKNWFLLGLVGAAALVLADFTEISVNLGLWLKANHGPAIIIVLIFFFSGLALQTRQVKEGLADIKGTLIALVLIFAGAPLIGLCFSILPLSDGILFGLLLVAAMPTTLSSGVVMTGAAGGNMAHALLITISANGLAVITIPVTLSLLLSFSDVSRVVEIDQLPIMIKIGTLVLLPLLLGIFLRNNATSLVRPLLPYTTICNQIGILTVVWMAACQGRTQILASMDSVILIIAVTCCFHFCLICLGILVSRITNISKGRRESVILMGGQKTLPLSLILQVSLFPEYGLALVVCVLHHISHLIMDAFLVSHLKKK